jgi:hypothetical protein
MPGVTTAAPAKMLAHVGAPNELTNIIILVAARNKREE